MNTQQVYPQSDGVGHLTVVTYNVENLFDTIASSNHADLDFTPDGAYMWTKSRYNRKLNRIANIILSVDTIHPADIIALEEVESDTVLKDLIHRTCLRSLNYHYVMTHSLDLRGVNVALLYNPLQFRLQGVDSMRLDGTKTLTRDVLHTWGIIPNGDTLHVYAVHLPSQLGGVSARKSRIRLLSQLATRIQNIYNKGSRAHTLLMGDFNSPPYSSDIKNFVKNLGQFFNLARNQPLGSYKFKGQWNWIDQIIVSESLCDTTSSVFIYPFKAQTFTSRFLLEEDPSDGLKKPYRTFLGQHYHGGYSDHLPVFVTIRFKH